MFRIFKTNIKISWVFEGQFRFSANKDSKWIYSSRHEEKLFRKMGKISIYNHVCDDTHNASLRLVEKINQAHVVFSNDPTQVRKYLSALSKMERFITPNQKPHNQSDSGDSDTNDSSQIVRNQQLVKRNQSLQKFENQIGRIKEIEQLKSIMSSTNIEELQQQIKNHTFSIPFDTEIEISKMIEMQRQINKQKGQQNDHDYIVKQVKQMKEFMEVKKMEERLKSIRDYQGYSAVFTLRTTALRELEQDGFKMDEILKMQKDGLNILFMFSHDDQQSIGSCGHVIKELEKQKIAYEILPSSDGLLKAIVCSGLPADRFSLQYFPKIKISYSSQQEEETFQDLLDRRKNMKITTCLSIRLSDLENAVYGIKKVFGKDHMVYIHGPGNTFFRNQIIRVQEDYLKKYVSKFSNQIISQNPTIFVVIAPYISQFNQELQKQLNIKSHIKGEIMNPKINPVEMKILIEKLEGMNKKEEIYEIDTHLMVAEMLTRIKDEGMVRKSLRKLFPRKKQRDLDLLMEEGKKHVVIDHLSLEEE